MSVLLQQPSPEATQIYLPGPDRRRSLSPYSYQLTHRAATEVGCVLAWRVLGGRAEYQVALERLRNGGWDFHCTCADAVFRFDTKRGLCKHIRGLLRLNEQTS